MKAVLAWLAITGSLLVIALFLHNVPENAKGPALTALLFIFTSALLVKVCRGSR